MTESQKEKKERESCEGGLGEKTEQRKGITMQRVLLSEVVIRRRAVNVRNKDHNIFGISYKPCSLLNVPELGYYFGKESSELFPTTHRDLYSFLLLSFPNNHQK